MTLWKRQSVIWFLWGPRVWICVPFRRKFDHRLVWRCLRLKSVASILTRSRYEDTVGPVCLRSWGDTYRAVYTVRLRNAVYVPHFFQKKSTHGIATARRDLDTINCRLREAESMDRTLGESR